MPVSRRPDIDHKRDDRRWNAKQSLFQDRVNPRDFKKRKPGSKESKTIDQRPIASNGPELRASRPDVVLILPLLVSTLIALSAYPVQAEGNNQPPDSGRPSQTSTINGEQSIESTTINPTEVITLPVSYSTVIAQEIGENNVRHKISKLPNIPEMNPAWQYASHTISGCEFDDGSHGFIINTQTGVAVYKKGNNGEYHVSHFELGGTNYPSDNDIACNKGHIAFATHTNIYLTDTSEENIGRTHVFPKTEGGRIVAIGEEGFVHQGRNSLTLYFRNQEGEWTAIQYLMPIHQDERDQLLTVINQSNGKFLLVLQELLGYYIGRINRIYETEVIEDEVIISERASFPTSVDIDGRKYGISIAINHGKPSRDGNSYFMYEENTNLFVKIDLTNGEVVARILDFPLFPQSAGTNSAEETDFTTIDAMIVELLGDDFPPNTYLILNSDYRQPYIYYSDENRLEPLGPDFMKLIHNADNFGEFGEKIAVLLSGGLWNDGDFRNLIQIISFPDEDGKTIYLPLMINASNTPEENNQN